MLLLLLKEAGGQHLKTIFLTTLLTTFYPEKIENLRMDKTSFLRNFKLDIYRRKMKDLIFQIINKKMFAFPTFMGSYNVTSLVISSTIKLSKD
jgi:hypothetical protein